MKTRPIIILLLSVVGLYAQDPHSAIQPVPREGGWVKRHESFNRKVQENQGAIDLIFVGDSITQGWEGSGRDVWSHYYGDRKALNLGIGGDRTQHVLWRLDHGNVEGISPKVAVVMIGTNNSADDRNSASEMVDGVRAVVAKLREKLPETKILLLGIFPRGEQFNAQRGKILQVNQAIRRLHDGETVHYLDIGHRFLDDGGAIPREIMPDFLHLTPRGYQVWAEAIEPALADLMGQQPKLSGSNPSGEWTWSMKGPEDRLVEAKLVLECDGAKLGGVFIFREDRQLKISEGRLQDGKWSFVVKRDRPNGEAMTYRMTATVDGDQMKGEVTTEFNGQAVTRDWTASRP